MALAGARASAEAHQRLRRDHFFVLALHHKLALAGAAAAAATAAGPGPSRCNAISVAQLWDEARHMDHGQWQQWLVQRMGQGQ